MSEKLSASEALYGFGAWLTCRDEPVTFSAKHEAGAMAVLVDEFCKTNNLDEPSDRWHEILIHPKRKTEATPCMHDSVQKVNGVQPVTMIACPCPKCSPTC